MIKSFGSTPKKSGSEYLNSIFSLKEKILLYLAVVIFLGSTITWAVNFYLTSTEKKPTFGGEYTEGITGQPINVNPVFAPENEVDAILCRLVFSSLMTYDEKGMLVSDLADRFEISEDRKFYTFYLKENATWHDKAPLTAKDVEFTINLIKRPSTNSSLRADWKDIKVSTDGDHKVIFELPEPYTPFLNKLTVGILPQHVYGDVAGGNFLLSEFNKKPIGSGPFMWSNLEQDSEGESIISYQLIANQSYYGEKAFLDKINFNFYTKEDELFDAYNKKEIDGFSVIYYKRAKELEGREDTEVKKAQIPFTFAIFLNDRKSVPLADKDVRKALRFATNRQEIVERVFSDFATPEYSPIISLFGEFSSKYSAKDFEYNPEKAEEKLENAGWKKGDDGLRRKNDQILELELISTNPPQIVETTKIIKEQWEKIGVRVNVRNMEGPEVRDNHLKPREFQMVVFGQKYFGSDPDPYNYWHSSEKKSGQNIVYYDNEDVDKYLKEARETNKYEERKEKYEKFEERIKDDCPVIYLYSLNHVYIHSSKIKGMENSVVVATDHRFNNANKWYVKTTRVKKEKSE